MRFLICTAGICSEINSDLEELQQLCRDYMVKHLKPEIHIDVFREEIDVFHIDAESNNHTRESVGSLALHKKLTEALLDKSVLLIHGAAVSTNNSAYMISAPSGTGKTYRAMQWVRQIPVSFYINGDKPYLKIEEDRVLACGSPWAGKEHLNFKAMKPLRAIFFLERADETVVTKLSFVEAFPKLLSQTYRPADSAKMKKTLELLKQLDGKVDFYQFKSTKEPEAVLDAYEAARPK